MLRVQDLPAYSGHIDTDKNASTSSVQVLECKLSALTKSTEDLEAKYHQLKIITDSACTTQVINGKISTLNDSLKMLENKMKVNTTNLTKVYNDQQADIEKLKTNLLNLPQVKPPFPDNDSKSIGHKANENKSGNSSHDIKDINSRLNAIELNISSLKQQLNDNSDHIFNKDRDKRRDV